MLTRSKELLLIAVGGPQGRALDDDETRLGNVVYMNLKFGVFILPLEPRAMKETDRAGTRQVAERQIDRANARKQPLAGDGRKSALMVDHRTVPLMCN
jgi:hypothetical protein